MISEPFRIKVWEEMLTAELTQLYLEKLGERYSSYSRNSKIFLAITSSTTVASWSLWAQYDAIWKILSGVSALVAVVVPLLQWEHSFEKAVESKGGWLEVSHEFQNLWLGIQSGSITNDQEVLRKTEEIFQKQKALDSKLSSFARDKKLIELCDDEVRTRRGLPLAPRKDRKP